jgi:hypothetical protein
MEPLNDPLSEEELNEYLRVWHAPNAPLGLKPPGEPPCEPRLPWWRWLVSGSIRVPVPAGLLAVVIVVLSVYWAMAARQAVDKPGRTVTLADFEPVKQLQPRIIRSGYEQR